MIGIIKKLSWYYIWRLAFAHFQIVPRCICQWIGKCSIDCQIQQSIDGSSLVYTVKNHPKEGKISDHFMNYQGGEFIYDYMGNRAKWNGKIGSQIDFGNGGYTVIAEVKKFKDFGWKDLDGMIQSTKILNQYLNKHRK